MRGPRSTKPMAVLRHSRLKGGPSAVAALDQGWLAGWPAGWLHYKIFIQASAMHRFVLLDMIQVFGSSD